MTRAEHARRVRWPRPTRRGVVLMAAGVVLFVNALFVDRRDLILIALIAVAVPALSLLFVASRRLSMLVARSFSPAVAPVGGSTTVSLVVRNEGRRATDGARWRDDATRDLVVPANAVLPAMGRWEGGPPGGDDTVRLEYTMRLGRRGVFGVGPLVVGISDPFGLAMLDRPFGEVHDVIVTPRVTVLGAPEKGNASIDGALHERLKHTVPNADELIAREYRYGDPLRRVNWPATARHGELMVRQEEQRSNPEARLIIDTTMTAGRRHAFFPGGDREDRVDRGFELAIEMAASIGIHLLRSGFRLEVTETGPSHLAPGPDRTRGGLFGDAPSSFLLPGGDSDFLEGLAHIPLPDGRAGHAQTEGDRTPVVRLGAAGMRVLHRPGFAVLVDVDADEVEALVALRAGLSPAVAFVLDTVGKAVLERLEDAGWTCVPLRPGQDLAALWAGVELGQGAMSGAH